MKIRPYSGAVEGSLSLSFGLGGDAGRRWTSEMRLCKWHHCHSRGRLYEAVFMARLSLSSGPEMLGRFDGVCSGRCRKAWVWRRHRLSHRVIRRKGPPSPKFPTAKFHSFGGRRAKILESLAGAGVNHSCFWTALRKIMKSCKQHSYGPASLNTMKTYGLSPMILCS